MGVKDQFVKLRDNWLIIVLVIVLLLFLNIGGTVTKSLNIAGRAYDTMESAQGYYPSPGYDDGDFAPDVEERKVIKTATMTTEIERGVYRKEETRLKDIIGSTGSYLLAENVYKHGAGRKEYYSGTYQIKVDTTKYDTLVSQLKGIGEVQAFSENTQDVTGQYTNNELNLELEKQRLERYQAMYDEAEDISDKIELNDRIFSQERTVKYLEDRLENMDERIDYTTVSFNMNEKQSEYANIELVSFSELVRNFMSSLNGLLSLLFVLIPWAVLALIGWGIWKFKK